MVQFFVQALLLAALYWHKLVVSLSKGEGRFKEENQSSLFVFRIKIMVLTSLSSIFSILDGTK